MITMARTIMITWLTPAMMVGAASGIRTPNMVWRGVAPNVCDASITLLGDLPDPEGGDPDPGDDRVEHRGDDARAPGPR